MSYQHILVPVDGSAISLSAVQHGAILAKTFGSSLKLISVIAENPFNDADFYYASSIMKEYFVQAHANAQQALQEAYNIAQQVGVEAKTEIITGLVSAETIAEVAQKFHADLIVIGSHGRKGFQKFVLGSFAQDVLGATELPVLVIKA